MKHLTFLIVVFICTGTRLLSQQNRISEYIDNYYIDKQSIENLFDVVEEPKIVNKYSNKLTHYKIVKINQSQLQSILKNKTQSLSLSIPFPDNTIHQLKMVSNGFNTNFFDINTSSNETVGKLNYVNYRGIIDNDKESFCALTFFENDLMGVAANKSVGNINIGKIKGEQDLYIIYFAKDVIKQPVFNCGVTDTQELPDNFPSQVQKTTLPTTASTKCIRIYLETDYALYQYYGNSTTNVTAYVLAMFNVWAAVFQNEGIKIEISQLYIWTTPDPFDNTSSLNGLATFKTIRSSFSGDYAHLLSKAGGDVPTGGRAYLGPACGSNLRYGYSGIYGYNDTLPAYSWDIHQITHEFGHNLGSNHTHWCGWPGGAIDDCYATEVGCPPGPTPLPGQGTIMSYCHVGTGINLALGFGPLPHGVIINEYNTRPCLGSCACNAAFAVTYTVVNETCAGYNDGAINVSISGGASPYFTKWNTNATSQSLSNIGPGTYSLVIGDANMCPKIIYATVQSLYPNPLITLTSPSEVCAGDLASISASGASTYTWSNGSLTPLISVNPLVTTAYSCMGTSSNGCTSSAVTTINVNPIPIVSISPGSTICDGSSVTIAMSGGDTYNWSTAETTANIVVSPSASTTYSCTAYSTKGCFNSASTMITVNPSPTVSYTVTNETCPGFLDGSINVSINGGISPYSALWSTSATSQNISNIGSGTYTLTIQDANMCPKVITPLVQSLYPNPVITLTSPGEVCAGNGTSISASGASTYTWSNGSLTPLISVTPLVTTAYSCLGTSSDGCTNSAVTTITVNPIPIVSISSGSTICDGSSATITMNGGATYSWSTAETTASILVSPSVSTTYSCTAYSTKGCFNSASTMITVNPSPTVSINSTTLCTGNSTSISANGATNYIWSTGATSASISVTPTVTTNYTCTGAYATGCQNTAIGSITVYALPMVSVTSTSVCPGDPAVLYAVGANNYNWSSGAFGTSSITISPSTNTTYTCTGTSIHGCTNTAVGQVVIYPTPTLAITSGTFCYGTTATVTAAPAISYTWSNGSHASSFFVVPNATTTYTCKGISAINYCLFTSTTTLVVINVSTPTISQAGSVLTSSSPSGNQWYLDGVLIPGATGQNYTVTQNGNYSVIVSDANGCSSDPANKTIFNTGFADIDLKKVISIFPNPAYDYLQIMMPSDFNEMINYKIYSDNGQLVKQEMLQNQDNRILLNDFSVGLYLIDISVQSHHVIYKFMKE